MCRPNAGSNSHISTSWLLYLLRFPDFPAGAAVLCGAAAGPFASSGVSASLSFFLFLGFRSLFLLRSCCASLRVDPLTLVAVLASSLFENEQSSPLEPGAPRVLDCPRDPALLLLFAFAFPLAAGPLLCSNGQYFPLGHVPVFQNEKHTWERAGVMRLHLPHRVLSTFLGISHVLRVSLSALGH